MATNPRGQTTLGGTPVTRASIEALLLQVNDIRPVANVTQRAQLVADLNAAGIGPAPSRPLYVDRADAPAGAWVERTTDGTNWRAVLTSGTPLSGTVVISLNGAGSVSFPLGPFPFPVVVQVQNADPASQNVMAVRGVQNGVFGANDTHNVIVHFFATGPTGSARFSWLAMPS